MPYVICQPCQKDGAYKDVCPVDCIYDAGDQSYIHPEECIDCGACEPECPNEAIFADVDVPDKWKGSIAKAYENFDLTPP